MAVTISNLDSGGNATGATSQATNSITPSSNKLILATITSRTAISTDPNQPTATGNGLTWVVVNSVVYDNTSSSRKRVTLFRAMGASPSSGAITFDFGGQSQTGFSWNIDQVTGMDTSGTNGSGAVVQSATAFDGSATVATITATLAAFASTNNATYGSLAAGKQVTNTYTAGSGFTLINSTTISGDVTCGSEFRSDNSTSVGWTLSENSEIGVIGVEIRAAVYTKNIFVRQAVNRASTY